MSDTGYGWTVLMLSIAWFGAWLRLSEMDVFIIEIIVGVFK